MSRAGRPPKTTATQWAQGALDEIEAHGVHALSVEGVARRLGVTKGGAYHHFADRRALLQGALALWEERQVATLNSAFGAIADPRERLIRMLRYSVEEQTPSVIVRFLAAPEDPDVAAALTRATAARVDLITRAFAQLGATPAEARHRALLAYGQYLGIAQLQRQDAGVLTTPARERRYVATVERLLLADLPGAAR